MGAVHSGSISDACLYHLVERNRLDTKEGRDMRGVLLYARFKDDILAIVKGRDNLRSLVAEMRSNAKPCYEIEVEKVSKEQVEMLDISVSRAENRIRWQPFIKQSARYIKPSARHIPLGPESNHGRKIHASWPVSEIRRMFSLSTNRETAEHFRSIKVARFRRFFLDPEVIKSCENWLPPIKSQLAKATIPSDRTPNRTIRVILPFHPCQGRVPAMLNALVSKWKHILYRSLGSVSVQVAWRNHGDRLCDAARRRRI